MTQIHSFRLFLFVMSKPLEVPNEIYTPARGSECQ